MEKELQKKSKFLSLLLRHQPEKLNLNMDKNGWVEISEIISKSDITLEEIYKIVENNDKKRFIISDDQIKIRANQGHSIDVDVELKKEIPPFILYHGTGEKNESIILKEGIKKMNRRHVHLSSDLETARNVGQRHGKPIIFEISARLMYFDGIHFYLSENKVWLTEYVDPRYIKLKL